MSPSPQPGTPPFKPALRDDIVSASRCFNRLTIE